MERNVRSASPRMNTRCGLALTANNLLLQVPSLCGSFTTSDNSFVLNEVDQNSRAETNGVQKSVVDCCFCCCGLRTKWAIYLVALIGICTNLSGLLFHLTQDQQLGYALPALCSSVLYLLIAAGQFWHKFALFFLFLLIDALLLLLWTILSIYLAVALIWLPEWCIAILQEYFEWEEFHKLTTQLSHVTTEELRLRLFLGCSLLLCVIYTALGCWIWWIVLQCYRITQNRNAKNEWLQNLNKHIRSIPIY